MKGNIIVKNYYNCTFVNGKEPDKQPEGDKKKWLVLLVPAIISNIDKICTALKPAYIHIENWFKELISHNSLH